MSNIEAQRGANAPGHAPFVVSEIALRGKHGSVGPQVSDHGPS